MQILVSTDRYFGEKVESIAQTFNQFDPTFSSRYLIRDDDRLSLVGEDHWEADKYHIFYLTAESEKIPSLIDLFKEKSWGEVITEVDDKYSVKGRPLFQSEEHKKCFPVLPLFQTSRTCRGR